MSKALKFARLIEKNPAILETFLRQTTSMESVKIKGAVILKIKVVLFLNYKIIVKILTTGNKTYTLEIHDSKEYFSKNIFSLSEFPKILNDHSIPVILEVNKKLKIIIREFIKGEPLLDILKNDNITLEKQKNYIKDIGEWLATFHNRNIDGTIPKACNPAINQTMEKIIISRIKEFIKPNIESLRPQIIETLNLLLKKNNFYLQAAELRLIHGDFQAANIFIQNAQFKIIDFDNLQLGNPARDIGRFLMQLENVSENFKILEKLFLESYLNNAKNIKNSIKFQKAISYYQAQMLEYIIMGTMWGEKIPDKRLVQKLVKKQLKLLKSL